MIHVIVKEVPGNLELEPYCSRCGRTFACLPNGAAIKTILRRCGHSCTAEKRRNTRAQKIVKAIAAALSEANRAYLTSQELSERTGLDTALVSLLGREEEQRINSYLDTRLLPRIKYKRAVWYIQ